ncbi:MAG: DUF333 domain-containing protein [Chloroflexota bacterium]|nr:DUF333 domain-containing protein [Chloroflexota bacterium]
MRNVFSWLLALLVISVSLMSGCASKSEDPNIPELPGTIWRLNSYVNEAGETVDALPNAEVTLEFKKDQIEGVAGCNHYFASYKIEGDKLTIGTIGSTERYCPGAGIMDAEYQYLAALGRVSSFTGDQEQLQLLSAEGQTLLTFKVPQESVGLANPASVYCEEEGGQVEIRDEENGQAGYCVFPDGSECEEWAFFRGECTP